MQYSKVVHGQGSTLHTVCMLHKLYRPIDPGMPPSARTAVQTITKQLQELILFCIHVHHVVHPLRRIHLEVSHLA